MTRGSIPTLGYITGIIIFGYYHIILLALGTYSSRVVSSSLEVANNNVFLIRKMLYFVSILYYQRKVKRLALELNLGLIWGFN